MKPALIAWAAVAAVAAVLALAPAPAPAGTLGPSRARIASGSFFDSRRASAHAGPRTSVRVARARTALAHALGAQAELDIDRSTGTPRVLQRVGGTLTPAAGGDRTRIALAYARANAAALGLTPADLDDLRLVARTSSPDGVLHLRWQQSYRGIPMYDNDLRVNVDRNGRVINLLGSPLHDPTVTSVDPLLSPLDALRGAMAAAGVRRTASIASGPLGPRRATRFSTGDSARLVLFGTGTGLRLAWHVVYQAGPPGDYDVVLDARTGALLHRVELTKLDADPTAQVWENYPGAAVGGAAQTRNLRTLGYLPLGAATLNGPNAHAWADFDGDGTVDGPRSGVPDEEVRSHQGGNFEFIFNSFNPQPLSLSGEPALCPSDFQCAWDPDTPASWQVNYRQEATQAFYYANEFHAHLEASPIGFDEASGAFDTGSAHPDPLLLRTDVGIAPGPGGAPSPEDLNNGSMTVFPDGRSPEMDLYLFGYSAAAPYRDVAGGDDAATVYHEYAHGLSGRLITSADGTEALNTVQAAAMSEAFSDWYAEDYLVARGEETDVPGQPGDIDFGRYSDYVPDTTRSQPIDCPVGAPAPACPGGQSGHAGGYTYGDFGRIAGHPEVHADGEIFSETLWDIRSALGSQTAEALITGAMRLSPPEPSFLDMRNAILAEDGALGGTHHSALWSIFAARGMGYYAAATSGDDFSPVQNFSPPPSGGQTGNVSGRVSDAETGAALAGVRVGIAGHRTTGITSDSLTTTTAADGTYHLNGLPVAAYPELVATGTSQYDTSAQSAQVSAGSTATRNFALHRDWAGAAAGAELDASNDETEVTPSQSCGARAAMDQRSSFGWSAHNPTSENYPHNILNGASPSMTIELPVRIDVTRFAIDPGATCLDDPSAATRDYRIETSSDHGATFTCAVATVAGAGCPAPVAQFTAASAHRLNLIAPRAGAANVELVRITLLHPLGDGAGQSGHDFIDLAELGVYGTTPDVPPSGRLLVNPNPTEVEQKTTFDASSFSDPQSPITSYRWDFDGDGRTNLTTASPRASFAYASGRTYLARVVAVDARGDQGAATSSVSVRDSAAPRFSVRRLSGARVRVSATCGLPCELHGSLSVSHSTARRAHIAARLTKGSSAVLRSGRTTMTLRIGTRDRRKLRHARFRRVAVTVSVRASDSRARLRKRIVHTTLKP